MTPILGRETTKQREMKNHPQIYWIRLIALLVIIIALLAGIAEKIYQLFPAGAVGSDWSTYLHDPQRTAAGGDTIISSANAGQLALQWAFKTGGVIASSPTVVGGTVYVGSWDGYEYALDAVTGQQKWKTFLGQTTASCYPQLAGVSSSADVENGVVYVGGGDSNWYALDATTGNILWKVFVGDNTTGYYNWASPLIYNGFAYIGTSSVGDCPLVPGQLLQVDLNSHQIVNTFNFVPQGQYGGGIWTSPSVDPSTNTIYVSTGTRNVASQSLSEAIVALDASTLSLKSSWAIPASQETLDSDFGSSPILFNDANGNPLVAAINKNGYLYAFNRNNVAAGPVWTKVITQPGSCPQCGDGSASSGTFGNSTLFFAGGNSVINGQGYRGSLNALDPGTGSFRWQRGEPGQVIPGLVYSNGLIIDGTGSTLEVLDASTGTRLYSYTTGGLLYAAPSVVNGQIFTGGVDGNVYAFGLPNPLPPPPPPDPNCPSSWTCQDIGSPTPSGSETVSGATWNVQVGGAGIGGSSDQFRIMSQTVSGNSQISTQVVSQQTTSGSAQEGLMVRQSNDPTAPYFGVFFANGNNIVVQYRMAFGGATTVASQVTSVTLPLYLEIQRVGDTFQAATSNDGVNYTLVPGSTVTVPMPTAVMDGVALSSGTQGTANTVVYSGVSVGTPGTPPNPPTSATPCPSGWSCSDIGNPSIVGDQSLSGGTWTLKGAGKTINGYADQFHYAWQPLSADGTVSAHILSQTNTNGGAQAGVMLRQSTDTSSPYYAAFVTPSSGILIQYRFVQGLRTTVVSGPTGTLPTYLMVARSGSTYCTYTSSDGAKWSVIIGSCVTMNINGSILAGLAVSSNNVGAVSTATFDTVTIGTTAPPPPTVCTGGWSCGDIGSPFLTGNQYLINGTWTVQGSGGDIWGTVDQFHFVSQSLAGDGGVNAHVVSQSNSSSWAKAGVMLRQTADPGSMYYAAFVTPSNGIVVQYRTTQGGNTQQKTSLAGAAPTYLWVARSGTTYTTYTSSDGVTWTPVAASTVTLNMSGSMQAGLAVTSHNTGALSTVTFDTVNVTTLPAPPVCPSGWSCGDIGAPALAGSQSLNGGTWTVTASGSDIWGTADQFRLVSQSLAANGSVSTRVVSQSNSSSWAKAGVMLRQTTDPGSMYYAAFVTPSNGITVQVRKAQGGTTQQLVTSTGTAPIYLWVSRSGTTYTTYTSSDGKTWTPVAGSSITLNMSGSVLAGLAVTSHNAKVLGTVTFDTVNIGTTVSPPVCPSGWSCSDIGAPALAGSQSLNGGTWTVTASGSDIWGTADQFRLVSQSLVADGSVSTRVVSQSNSSSWAKAGVMLRQTTDPGSMYYAVFVTPSNGIVVQVRKAQGGNTQQLAASTGTAPIYLWVSRSGTTYTTYTSSDGVTWTQVAGSTVTLNMSGSVLAGLAVTSHNAGALSTVTFDTVSIGTTVSPPVCPSGWSCGDIGAPALAGNQSLNGGTWTINASGSDIWGTADQFHFVSQSLAADGSVTAHVVSQSNSSSWAKAGVMLRQTTDSGSMYYAVFVTPGNGIVVQVRKAQGGNTQQLVLSTGTVPIYLAVARTGTTYTTYTSSDGNTWTPVAGSSITLNMSGSVLAGLAVTSHNAKVLGTVVFDTVNIGTTIP